MNKKVILLRRTKLPNELRYIHESSQKSTKIQPHIAALEVCGWFLMYEKQCTDKTNLLLTSVETTYKLRDEGVRSGCFFKNDLEFYCAACKQIT
jgi:hypothetical protein